MRSELIYWRDVPMDVDLGSFEYITKNWGNKIIVVCMRDFDSERKQCNWQDYNIKNVETIILDKYNRTQIVKKVINDYPNAIHIFNGIRGEKQKYLKYYIAQSLKPKIAIIAERPSFIGSAFVLMLKKLAFFIIYSFHSIIYGEKVSCFLPLGEIGVKVYKKYGWNKNKLFSYMYNPKLPEITNNRNIDKVKFLYIGRFDASAKGVDVLMAAIDLLGDQGNWKLDLVGGYGPIKDQVISWAKGKRNVEYIGIWNSNEVCNKMIDYDICIVPSKYDGWNLTPNQAIKSHIVTIITDKAGSDELIKKSGAGIVIPANSSKKLAQAMRYVNMNNNVIDDYKQKAKEYSPKISSETVGQYFIDIMDYTFQYRKMNKPKCPWLDD